MTKEMIPYVGGVDLGVVAGWGYCSAAGGEVEQLIKIPSIVRFKNNRANVCKSKKLLFHQYKEKQDMDQLPKFRYRSAIS